MPVTGLPAPDFTGKAGLWREFLINPAIAGNHCARSIEIDENSIDLGLRAERRVG
jgi:hypothetical protein